MALDLFELAFTLIVLLAVTGLVCCACFLRCALNICAGGRPDAFLPSKYEKLMEQVLELQEENKRLLSENLRLRGESEGEKVQNGQDKHKDAHHRWDGLPLILYTAPNGKCWHLDRSCHHISTSKFNEYRPCSHCARVSLATRGA